MKIRTLAEGRVAVDVSGFGLVLSPKEAIDLALAIAGRALGRDAKPSPVDRLTLSATRDALGVLIVADQAHGLTTTIRTHGGARAWISVAVRLFAAATDRPDATLDDLLDSEFPEEGGQS